MGGLVKGGGRALVKGGGPAAQRSSVMGSRTLADLELDAKVQLGEARRADKVLELSSEVGVAALAQDDLNVLGGLCEGSGCGRRGQWACAPRADGNSACVRWRQWPGW